MNLFTIIFLSFLILGTSLQLWLAQRQKTHVRQNQNTVPEAFEEKISVAEHQKAARYTLAKTQFAQLMLVIEALIVLLWTLGGLLNGLDQSWRTLGGSTLWTGVAMMMSVMLISALLDLPANIYNTFSLEARFGFNRMTIGLFSLDLVKSLLLMLVIGIPFAALVLWLMLHMGTWWWLSVWLVWMGFNLLMIWAYPTFIAPWFNQFKPLDNEELKQRIEKLLQRNGFASQGVFVMDGSKRSGHGNAYFTGLGTHKRIVFFDTLLDGLTADEVEAVLAHEIGHFKRKHIQKRMLWMAVLSLASLALLGWLMQQQWFYHDLGVSTPSTYMALLLFILVIPVFSFFLHPLLAWFSRQHEFEADDFAAQQANAQTLIHALVKLYKENASTLTPDPLYSAVYDSHPPAPVRIKQLTAKMTTA